MKIGIIGAGKVGVSIGKYLKENGAKARVEVTGFFSRSSKSTVEAAEFTGTEKFENIARLVETNEIIFITVPDDNIQEVYHDIRKYNTTGKILCHFSGVLSSEIFDDISKYGAYAVSIHPVYAFADKYSSYINLGSAHLVMEGMKEALAPLEKLFKSLNHTIHVIDTCDKSKYHAAAAICSNHVVALIHASVSLFCECGFEKKQAMKMIEPLVKGNIENIFNKGCKAALTGPVERNDIKTVKKHLEALNDNKIKQAYIETAKIIVDLAEQKNPDRDYRKMSDLF